MFPFKCLAQKSAALILSTYTQAYHAAPFGFLYVYQYLSISVTKWLKGKP